jgi:hypothetical protein
MSRVYYDQAGRRRTSPTEVPVDQYGQVTGAQFTCRRCKVTKWFPAGVASKGTPACENDGLRMVSVSVQGTSLLPWSAIWAQARPQLVPVWAFLAAAAVGAGTHAAHLPPVAAVALAVPLAVLVARIVRTNLTARAVKRGRLDDDTDSGGRLRANFARRARTVGYWTAVGCLWLALAAHTGMDPNTVGGKMSWTVLAAVWLLPAATWWRWVRKLRDRRDTSVTPTPEPEPEPEPDGGEDVPMDPDEAQTRRVWSSIVAARKDEVVGTKPDGTTVKASRNGRLVGTWLEDWHKVEGGWGATVVGPDGDYTADAYWKATGAIASAFRMKASMVTCIPDGDDENRALFLAQRTSPIRGVVRWTGPSSIDIEQGTAPVVVYADGDHATYEVFREGWGTPHVFACGTTGVGKSEFLNLLFTIDRWASHVDAGGNRRGLVASFLIDPQQGQSFAPFLDDLAAPVATTIAEAKLLVLALHLEMLRRNRYLAREAKTWDARRNRWRKGRKWWDPRIDGPILTLTIDEAHLFLADREFRALVTAAGRMWRKCGGQIRLSTHTPLLGDLGDMALRDMLTGGLVAVFRTANSLSGPVAFNARLPVDPRSIPADPGSCYVLTGAQPKPMLGRAMYEPDWYDWVRDDNDQPIGYPAPLPPETLAAFGPEYAAWVQHASNPDAGLWVPQQAKPQSVPEPPARCVDAVRLVLAHGGETGSPMDMEAIDAMLRKRGVLSAATGKPYSTRTLREALSQLRKGGEVHSADGRHELTPQALANVVETSAVAAADGLSNVA